jgi:hypothetical protein
LAQELECKEDWRHATNVVAIFNEADGFKKALTVPGTHPIYEFLIGGFQARSPHEIQWATAKSWTYMGEIGSCNNDCGMICGDSFQCMDEPLEEEIIFWLVSFFDETIKGAAKDGEDLNRFAIKHVVKPDRCQLDGMFGLMVELTIENDPVIQSFSV